MTTQTTTSLHMIPDGPVGINATLRMMGQVVKEYKKSVAVRGLASRLVSGLKGKDWAGEVRAIHAYVRDNIRYLNDIDNVETLITPDKVIEQGQGDCDDKSMLLAALLGSIGHPTRFIAIGFQAGVYSHVYVETLVGTQWIPLETTEDVECGWQPEPRLIIEKMYYFN